MKVNLESMFGIKMNDNPVICKHEYQSHKTLSSDKITIFVLVHKLLSVSVPHDTDFLVPPRGRAGGRAHTVKVKNIQHKT